MESPKIVFHVGYPKAGSSTLQLHLFNNHPQINYLGLHPLAGESVGQFSYDPGSQSAYLASPELRALYHHLVRLRGVDYYCSDRRALWEGVLPLLSRKKLNLFSHEALSDAFSADRLLKARRVQELFPQSRILIIIRNQTSLLRSQYDDHPFDPRCRDVGPPLAIGAWLARCFELQEELELLGSLDYERTSLLYQELFGPEAVRVMVFERMAQDPAGFAEELSRWLGVEPGPSRELLQGKHENRAAAAGLWRFRRLQRRFPLLAGLWKQLPFGLRQAVEERLRRGDPHRTELPPAWRRRLEDHYRDSNRRLADRLGLDLAGHGYPV